MPTDFDAIVIGAGPGGEVPASRLHNGGMRVALVERELIGGECAYWACIPSKTLLRPPEARTEAIRAAGVSTPEQDWASIRDYRDTMLDKHIAEIDRTLSDLRALRHDLTQVRRAARDGQRRGEDAVVCRLIESRPI
jgi:pyruvate/2-oxoglutarate dehydrogenase complex dihydrolipoamide dehydrogenase (E3) component